MVIPVHDENPVRRTPYVTYVLIALNIVFFFVEPIEKVPTSSTSVTAICEQTQFFDRYAAIPKELTTNHELPPHRTVVRTQRRDFACPNDDFDKSPLLSVLTAMFLHGGWLHLLGNMLFLFVFGNNVEDRLGRVRFLLFYLFWGYIAAYVFAFGFPDSTEPLIGASGAIAGVLGAYLVLFPRARVLSLVPFLLFIPVRLPAWVVLGSWFLLQWFYATGNTVAEGAGVAYLAHVGGFVAGVVTVLALRLLGGGTRSPPLPLPHDGRR